MVPAAGADGGMKPTVARLMFELSVVGPVVTVSVRGEDETCDVPLNKFSFYVDRRAPLRRIFECALAGLVGVTARGAATRLDTATSRDLLGAMAHAISDGLKSVLGGMDDGASGTDQPSGEAGAPARERSERVVVDEGVGGSATIPLP